jgi:predicted amidohydrolase
MTRGRVAPTAPWRHRAASLGCDRARDPAACGEQLLVLPAAWAAGQAKKDHRVTLVRARAIENTIWLAAAGSLAGRREDIISGRAAAVPG